MKNSVFAFDQALKNQTKKEVVANKILEMIVTGLLRDGDVLPSERELGQLFSVSRETIRGAIGLISAYGLIQVSHGSKTRIRRDEATLERCVDLLPKVANVNINHFDMNSVFEARKVVESSIIRNVAARIDEQGLEQMEEMLEQQKLLFADPVHFQLSDQRFHKLISDYSGNPILNGYSSELYGWGLNFRRSVMSHKGNVERSYQEHVAIFNALRLKDPDRSEQAMLNHLNSVYQTTADEVNGN